MASNLCRQDPVTQPWEDWEVELEKNWPSWSKCGSSFPGSFKWKTIDVSIIIFGNRCNCPEIFVDVERCWMIPCKFPHFWIPLEPPYSACPNHAHGGMEAVVASGRNVRTNICWTTFSAFRTVSMTGVVWHGVTWCNSLCYVDAFLGDLRKYHSG